LKIDQQKKLNEALSQLKKLELDKALGLFYQLLDERPNDLQLIKQIYSLESRKKTSCGFNQIARHIFTLSDKSDTFHPFIIKTFLEYKEKNHELLVASLTEQQIFNLFYHLGQTGFSTDIEILLGQIKGKFADNIETPEALFTFCEQLTVKKQYLRAITELEYLMIYYTEANTQIPAEKLIKTIRAVTHFSN